MSDYGLTYWFVGEFAEEGMTMTRMQIGIAAVVWVAIQALIVFEVLYRVARAPL